MLPKTASADAAAAPQAAGPVGQPRRVTWLTDPVVQFGLLRRIAIHWLLLFACNAVGLLLWVRLLELPDQSWSQSVTVVLQRFLPFFLITAVVLPAFVVDTLKLTNRITGPIRRLRGDLGRVAAGQKVTKLKFRGGDFFSEIAEPFNRIVERIERIERLQTPAATDPAKPQV